MLSRFLIPPLKTTSHHLPFLTTLISSNKYLPPPPNPIHNFHVMVSQTRFFSSNTSGGKDDNPWKITAEDDIFKEEDGNFSNDIGTSRANGGKDDTTHNNPWKITDQDDIFKDFSNDIGTSRANVGNVESWDVTNESKTGGDVFGDIDKEVESRKSVVGSRRTSVGNVESWDFTSTNESKTGGDVFGDVDKEFESKEKLGGIGSRRSNVGNVESWNTNETKGDVFGDIDKESGGGGEEEWESAQEMKGWSIGDDDKVNDIFNIGGEEGGIDGIEDLSSEVEDNRNAKNEVQQELEMEKKQLLLQLKGPNRAFGDLIAAAGITDAMLDSLIALKDLEGVEGLSPLSEIEDTNSEKSQNSYTRAEIERQKQEEIDKSRVRRVDEKGRAYGTGRRKCSVARVWIEPGEGKFIVNDKQFDVYFPIIDHRADLLRPFCETKTLGLWDVKCTVKGGGVSGQVGAVRLGISRALQNWEPGLRSDLKAVGFLTRDPRMVERKKPGKAKARKSFQWVKR